MPSQSLWRLAGRMLLGHKTGYVLPLFVVVDWLRYL